MRVNSFLKALLVVIILAICTVAAAEGENTEEFNSAWSYANANVIKAHFESFYFKHCQMLLEAEKTLASNKDQSIVLNSLKSIPGIKAVVISKSDGKGDGQWPEGAVNLEAFSEQVFAPVNKAVNPQLKKTPEHRQPRIYKAPMMHRTVGGKVSFVGFSLDKERYDLLTRFFWQDSAAGKSCALSLVLDPSWLVSQIPAVMDSLFRENCQLLFWAPSPLNDQVEQSIGIIYKGDTLWWNGSKDVKVANIQVLWPIEGIKVHSYIHHK